MDDVLGIPLNVLTPSALGLAAIAVILTSFARGWIVSRFTVETMLAGYKELAEQANKRAEDYKEIAERERARADVIEKIATDLTVVGETASRILGALPHNREGGKTT